MLSKLKSISFGLLGLAVPVLLIFIFVTLMRFGPSAANFINPFLVRAATITFLFDLLILLPLAFFKKTRGLSGLGFYFSSFIFGLSLWVFGFLVTFYYWGLFGVIVGLFIAGVGVVPIAVIAALFHHDWTSILNIVIVLFETFGVRFLGAWLIQKSEDDTVLDDYASEIIEYPPSDVDELEDWNKIQSEEV